MVFVTAEPAKLIPGQIMPIDKPPHLRSKAPLQQIMISEIPRLEAQTEKGDQHSPKETPVVTKPLIEVIDIQDNSKGPEPTVAKDEKLPDKDISKSKGLASKIEKEILTNVNTLDKSQNEKKKLKKPSTSVQFASTWSKLSNHQEKELYLHLLNTTDYPKVFRHSMEPSIFSSILEVLGNLEKNLSPHLLGMVV